MTRRASQPRIVRVSAALAGALALASVAAACGAGSGEEEAVAETESAAAVTTTVEATTTTTTIPVVRAPLTGAQAPDESVLARPALVVKIDNHPQARPQWNQIQKINQKNGKQSTIYKPY